MVRLAYINLRHATAHVYVRTIRGARLTIFQQIIVERNDMRQDQRLLREIRQQLLNRADHLDVNSNSNVETVDSGERPYLEERHIRRAT
ncbi:hypothetical protein J6590_089806 [Homalodisca vitripennis]|nr:hypothetical protein J6590_089806 [Homalodisca vitripennis]